MTVPKNLPEGLSHEAVARHKALTETGVPNIAYLTHGRANHPTSNLAKPIRRLARTSGAQTLELDLHASHTCLLLAKIAASHSKTNSVIEVQGGSWYGQFTESYGMYLLWAESQRIAYRDADGNWFTWSAKHNRFEPASIKVEYQRQCLFWSDHRPEANLMRQTLRSRHYALYNAIMEHRETLNASKFSTLLTRREGALFVKDLVPTLHARGITVVSNNDGVIVPKQHAAAAVEAMEVIAFQHLGFVPHISIK